MVDNGGATNYKMPIATDRILERRSRRRRSRWERRNFADSISSRGCSAEEATNCAPGDIETSGEVAQRDSGSVPPLTLVEINYSENKDSHPSRVIARLQVADRLQVQRAITSAFDNYSQRRGSTANT